MASLLLHLNLLIIFFGIFVASIEAGILDFKRLLNSTDADSDEFAKLMDRFKFRASNASDVNRRLGNFRKAKKNLDGFRAKFKRANFTTNKFSLMTKEEQQQFFGAMPIQNPSEETRGKRSALDGLVSASAPASFDFRTYGKVTPIKNQAQCGSCWAFSSTATVESQYLLRYNQTLDLSEQNLVSCNTGTSKCNGGDILNAFNYIKTNGIATESCQPYSATNGTCSTACNTQKYYIGGYKYFGNDESTFAAQLYNYGPATMAFYVPQAFMSYSSGILDFPAQDCINNNIGMHGMVIVGYTADYWIAKNSWGTDWGEQGYVRFKRGQNFCGMTIQVAAPFLNVTGTTTTVKVVNTTTTPATTTTSTTPAPMAGCSAGNGVNTMTNALRNAVLDVFNARRSEIAKGTFKMKNGITAPAAQNMKKLTYNCTLEAAALNYITTCNSGALIGNTYTTTLAFGSIAPIGTAISMAPTYLVSFTAAQQGTGMIVTDGSAAFANDGETQIGCAYTTTPCGSTYPSVLICTITPLQPSTTTPLYTVGGGCTSNAQCTKPGYNKCDTTLKLCYA